MASAAFFDRPLPLPIPLTPLVGRERENAAVVALLRDPSVRLLTLTGPGGVGKTRFALHLAADLADAFVDGVRFVPLAAIRDPVLVLPTVAQALGLVALGGQSAAAGLRMFLRERELLLLLDNVEQVVAAAPELADLLAGCPGLKLLATSRETLRVAGEREFPVPPLALPDATAPRSSTELATCEAVALFVQRARAKRPDFAVTDESAVVIAEICRRLDGLPLAIELAATRINVLSPPALLARLGNRLALLSGGPRHLPARLQTMRDAIAWSYELLDPSEQRLFRRLSVFVGGFTLAATEAVVNDAADPSLSSAEPGSRHALGIGALDGITSLVDKSLVRLVELSDGEPRYVMLETIREFGFEQLAASGEAETTRQRLAIWGVALAAQSYDEIKEPAQRQWLARLEAEHDNFRAVLAWALDHGEAETAQRLVGELARFWWFHGHLAEGRNWAERALRMSDHAPAVARAKALGTAGLLASAQGDYERAFGALTESVSIWRTLGDAAETAVMLWRLGMAAADQRDFDRATALLDESFALCREQGLRLWAALLHHSLGLVAYEQADAGRAVACFDDALREFRALDNPWYTSVALGSLGKIARARGDYTRAAALYTESLSLRWDQVGDKMGIAASLRALASIAALTGLHERAVRLYGAAEALREALGAPVPRTRALYEESVAKARVGLGEPAFAAALAAGRALPLAEAVAEALAAPEGRPPTSRDHFGLTPREAEVLRLLPRGLTNRELGERLFITERTAAKHVENILPKLGVGSRVEAAAFAVAHGLA